MRNNLWLQAKAVGDQLVVGLIPDCEILRCKGPPVLNERERLRLVESIKWVDEVITGGLGVVTVGEGRWGTVEQVGRIWKGTFATGGQHRVGVEFIADGSGIEDRECTHTF